MAESMQYISLGIPHTDISMSGSISMPPKKSKKTVKLQLVEWKTYDISTTEGDDESLDSTNSSSDHEQKNKKEEKQYCVDIFAKDHKGRSVCVRTLEYQPYFFLEVPDTWTKSNCKTLVNMIIMKFKRRSNQPLDEFVEWKLCNRKRFNGFTNHQDFKFIKFVFTSKREMSRWIKIFIREEMDEENMTGDPQTDFLNRKRFPKNSTEVLETLQVSSSHFLARNLKTIKDPWCLKLYESNVDPLLRFIHDLDIVPGEWIEIPKRYKVSPSCKQSHCYTEYHLPWDKITVPKEDYVSVPMVTACFDIECTSSHGDFPLAKKDYTKLVKDLIQLSFKTTLNKQAIYKILKNIHTQDYAYTIEDTGDVHVIHRVYTKTDTVWPNKTSLNVLARHLEIRLWLGSIAKTCSSEKKIVSFNLKDIHELLHLRVEVDVPTIKTWLKGIDPLVFRQEAAFTEDKSNPKICFRYYSAKDPMNFVEKVMVQQCNQKLPPLEGDPIIQIGTAFQRHGQSNSFRDIMLSLGSCSSFDDSTEVECFENESDLLLRWQQIINEIDPDIITGYNIYMFDLPYLIERADECGILEDFHILGRMKNLPSRITEKKGKLNSKFVEIPGRIEIDLLKIVNRDYSLPSYKLDFVASNFIRGGVKTQEMLSSGTTRITTDNTIGIKKGNYVKIQLSQGYTEDFILQGFKYPVVDVDKNSITIQGTLSHEIEAVSPMDCMEKARTDEIQAIVNDHVRQGHYSWSLGKDDVTPQEIFECQKGDADDRGRVAKYCMMDVILCLELMSKLQIISNNLGMANVCSTPFSWIFTRGQGVKIQSLMVKECSENKYLIPTTFPDANVAEGYEGAIVLKPYPGIYLDDRPVVVLDYASLYPSSMQAENLSHETIVLDKQWLGDEGGEAIRALGYDYVDITFDNYTYINDKKIKDGKKTCRFVQYPDGQKGIVPNILGKLLKARKTTRAKIKHKRLTCTNGNSYVGMVKHKDDSVVKIMDDATQQLIEIPARDVASLETAYTPFEQSVFDGLQLAYKVTANSLYGQLGAPTSPVYFKDIAASTTATGREQLYLAKNYIEKHFDGAKIVYGDTDSVFVSFKTEKDGVPLRGKAALAEAIRLGQEAERGIKKILKKPQDLEYEKTFMPFILFSKKRYVGNKYEFDLDKFKQTSMGIVLKRRDNAPILKIVYGGVIDILLNKMDIALAVNDLQRQLREFIHGKYGLDKLIITKSLNAYYKTPDKIAHKILADRIAKRDPGNKPQAGDRIPFIYIQSKDPHALQGDKIESPQFIRDHNLKPDFEFYITNQIMKPVSQIFGLCVEKLTGFKHDREYFQRLEKGYLEKGFKEDKIEDLLKTKRQRIAEDILFKDIFRVCNSKNNASQDIKKWFCAPKVASG